MREAAGFNDIHAAIRVGAGAGRKSEQDAIIIVSVVNFGDECVEFNRLISDLETELFQIMLDQHRHLFARVVADVGIQDKFNRVAVGVGRKVIAIALLDSDLLEQCLRLVQVMRILMNIRIEPFFIARRFKTVSGNAAAGGKLI